MKRFLPMIFVLTMIFSGCGRTSPDRPFTAAEVHQFVTTHNVQPLAVQTVAGMVTVIAWHTATTTGCDMMTSYHPHGPDDYFGTRHALAASILPPTVGERIVVSHSGILLGDYEVVCLVMLDPVLQAQVKRVKVVFFDGTQQDVAVEQQAVIVVSRVAPTLSTKKPDITMYDAAGTLVFTVDPRTIK